MSDRLAGKVVLITGAGSGLGRESALLFAHEGARVVVTDVRPERVERVVGEIGAAASGVVCDVRVPAQCAAAVDHSVEVFGAVDALMCSAGVPEEGFGTVPFEQITDEAFATVVGTNLGGVFHACRAVLPQMKAQGGGTILAVSSMAGLVAYPGFAGYAASKHGVNGLVKAMSLDLGRFGIRANALCPAHGMSVNFAMAPDADVLGLSYEQMQPSWDAMASSIPLKIGRPPVLADNANAALFLVSDESAYMSGVCLPATDGGNLARISIIFPDDLAAAPAEAPAGVLPDDLVGDRQGTTKGVTA